MSLGNWRRTRVLNVGLCRGILAVGLMPLSQATWFFLALRRYIVAGQCRTMRRMAEVPAYGTTWCRDASMTGDTLDRSYCRRHTSVALNTTCIARVGQENLLTSPSVYSVFDLCRPSVTVWRSVRTSPPHRLSWLRRPDAGRGVEQTRSVKRWVNME